MGDNKVFALPNNYPINLKPNMRMFFEIRNLKFAQVSSPGILYITDDEDYLWRGYRKSWMNQMNFRKKFKKILFRYIFRTIS